MSTQGNRFSNMYRPTLSALTRLQQSDPRRDAEARQSAQNANTFGSLMGPLGAGLGTAAGIGLSFIPGAQPFAPMIISGAGALGGAVGNAAGTAMKNNGEAELDPIRERELKKAALMELLGRYR